MIFGNDPLDACTLPMVWPGEAGQSPLHLMGGVVQAQRLVVPPQVIAALPTYRHACRMAWKLRRVRNLTRRSLAEQVGLYPPHVTDYFSRLESRRELPARHVAAVERVLGNTVITQWLNRQAQVTTMEELRAAMLKAA
jgi:hypothetical protein